MGTRPNTITIPTEEEVEFICSAITASIYQYEKLYRDEIERINSEFIHQFSFERYIYRYAEWVYEEADASSCFLHEWAIISKYKPIWESYWPWRTQEDLHAICKLIAKGYTVLKVADVLHKYPTREFKNLYYSLKSGRSHKSVVSQYPELGRH